MRKGPPASRTALTAAPAVLAVHGLLFLASCTADAPAPTTTEVEALAQSVKDAITTDALMTYSAMIAEHERPSGGPGENAAIDTIVATLEGRGVPVLVHELAAYASDPVSATVTVPGTDFSPPAITMAYSASSRGTVGEVVDMGTLAELPRLEAGTGERLVIEGEEFGADLPDLGGKVAIVDGQPRNVPTIALERMGAAAVVFVNPEERLNELIVTSTCGSPSLMNHHRLPRIPVAQIMRSAGEELRALMADGPVELRVETEVATGWKTMRLALATIEPAGVENAPYVVLGGHIDGWYHGATDEAASNAAMLAMALAFHDVRDRLRHGLVVAWWPGHSNARYAGSTWFADEFFTELRARGLAYMNIDGVGQMGARRFGAAASEAFRPFASRVVAETQGVDISPSRPGRNSDQAFNGVGLPLLQFNHTRLAEDGGYWWWHTTEDTYDKIDGDVLKTDTDIYAHALAEMLAGARYPVSLVAQVEALAAAIAVREEAAGGALQLDRHLGNRMERLRRVAADLDERADAGEIGAVDQVAFVRPLHRVMYVPLNDYHPDPGVSLGPLPGLAPARILVDEEADSDRRGFAVPVLMRERNRLIEAVDEALDVGYMRTTLASIRQELSEIREERDR
ncbi:MAG: M28 family peptidase [Gemmatimonadetes bacterium]|nr:M28 family peptidase [Gemmatimonadota bacterium]MYG35024.1 M28 family peptidase [Gemmatimonadota bacterium]